VTAWFDHSFVRAITADPVDAAIIGAIIAMGKTLGHRVVAEGVETREQVALLQTAQCGEGQGYYFSRPLEAEQFAGLLDRS